jgi:hypothetical protein
MAWIVQKLHGLGLQTTVTFDLQVARHGHVDCSCPHHGTDQCDCQMVVILVYGASSRPASLVVHSHHGKTQFSLVDLPQQSVNVELEESLLDTLLLPADLSFRVNTSHVD